MNEQMQQEGKQIEEENVFLSHGFLFNLLIYSFSFTNFLRKETFLIVSTSLPIIYSSVHSKCVLVLSFLNCSAERQSMTSYLWYPASFLSTFILLIIHFWHCWHFLGNLSYLGFLHNHFTLFLTLPLWALWLGILCLLGSLSLTLPPFLNIGAFFKVLCLSSLFDSREVLITSTISIFIT